MTDDTPALTSRDLETITAALWPVWLDLQSRCEHPAADWIGARINDCAGETVGRFNRMNEELDLIEAGTGHVTLVGCDEPDMRYPTLANRSGSVNGMPDMQRLHNPAFSRVGAAWTLIPEH